MKMQVCPECDVAGGRGGPGGPGGASAGFGFGGAGRRNSPRASKDPDLEDSKNAGWPDDSGHGPARLAAALLCHWWIRDLLSKAGLCF